VSTLHFLTEQSVDIAANAVIANYKATVGGDTTEISNMYDIIKAVFQGFDEKAEMMASRLLYEFDKISDDELEMRITGMCNAVADMPNELPSYMDKLSGELFGKTVVTHHEIASSMQQKMHDGSSTILPGMPTPMPMSGKYLTGKVMPMPGKYLTGKVMPMPGKYLPGMPTPMSGKYLPGMPTPMSGSMSNESDSMKTYQTINLRIKPVGYVNPPKFVPDPDKNYSTTGYATDGMLPSHIMNTEIAEKLLLFIHSFLTNMSGTVSKFCSGERKRSDVRKLLVKTIELAQEQYKYWKAMGVIQIGHMYGDYRKLSNVI
jgi:hypothetical protein